jgi:hypothetical protein
MSSAVILGMVAVVMIILAGACLVLTRPYHTGQATHGIVRSPNGTIHAIRRGIVDVRLTMMLWRCLRWSPFPACVGRLTKFASLLLWVTAIKLSVTQGP